jgi:hypothetical protein
MSNSNSMKTRIIFLNIIFLTLSVYSQNDQVRKSAFGIYAGFNGSQLLSDSALETKMRIGYQYGAFFRLGNQVFLRGDIALFAMSSKRVDVNDTTLIINPELEDIIDINFLHIPVQLGFKIFSSPDGTSSLWIAGGGYLDQIYRVKPNQFGLAKSDFKTTSLGILGTVGLDLWFLTFQMSYQYGMTPILKIDDESLKYSLSFSVGIKF